MPSLGNHPRCLLQTARRLRGGAKYMVMLSQLLRFKITDEHGAQAKLSDLSVALLDADHPPVTCLYFVNAQRQKCSIPWEKVRAVDWREGVVKVDDLGAARVESTDSLAKAVLLGAGILDAMVLDLQNRRATRANDLLLEEHEGKLLLQAADTGIGAIARRLTRGLFGQPQKAIFMIGSMSSFCVAIRARSGVKRASTCALVACRPVRSRGSQMQCLTCMPPS